MPEKSILVVDDNPASRVFLANHLRGKQFKALEAPTGKEGLIAAWRDRPDLILFDPALRDISDEEFIQKLRQDARTMGTPLIALSSDRSEARREICLNAGVNEYHLANRLKGERIGQIVDTLCSAYDFVILDIGRSLSRISLPLIQKADLRVLIVSTDQSTVKLTQTTWNYLLGQGIHGQRVYAILNRAVGLEGLTKGQAEEMITLGERLRSTRQAA